MVWLLVLLSKVQQVSSQSDKCTNWHWIHLYVNSGLRGWSSLLDLSSELPFQNAVQSASRGTFLLRITGLRIHLSSQGSHSCPWCSVLKREVMVTAHLLLWNWVHSALPAELHYSKEVNHWSAQFPKWGQSWVPALIPMSAAQSHAIGVIFIFRLRLQPLLTSVPCFFWGIVVFCWFFLSKCNVYLHCNNTVKLKQWNLQNSGLCESN